LYSAQQQKDIDMAKQRGGTNTGGGNSKIVNVGVKAGSRNRDLATPGGATQPGAIEFMGSRPLIAATGKAFGPGMGNSGASG
jgi:hypothetical protein